ncbi:disease resistance protein RGA2-like [Carex rostrata]
MYASSSLASYSVTNTKASIPDGMAKEIKDITERFEEISDAREKLHLREEDGTRLVSSPQIRPPTSSHMDERATFGRKEEKEEIISLMNSSTGPDFMVLPIVGMGGFGKTTLAQLVFNDSRIHGLFNKRCWVSVSDNFDLVQLTKALINSLHEKGEKPCEFSELNTLQDILKEKISGHGLFLVLDDVWNEQRNLWERFRVGFLGAKFVRILMTTRNTSVAKIMQTTSHFQLSSLPEENCWSLFKHFAFGSRETSENANLHEIGHGIVEKCKGSPLAIKALGGILRYEMDEDKWREILESDISEIDETREVMPALRLSYQKLPQHLKPCFLYLSIFPKDFNFEKDMVIRLWMAQGYINGNSRNLKTLEEIGSEYFDELQGRSLVDGGPSSYILHDLIHDLARSVSQEAYWPVVENDHGYNGVCKVCHLYFTKKDELLGLVPSTYRSIRTFGKYEGEFDFSIFSEIACARALHLVSSSLPNTFGTFKHLRYLFVLNMQIKVLPETLCLLYNLQTLVLECANLEELPKNMKNLINLWRFELSSIAIQHLPESIFPLPNLQILSLSCCDKIKELPRGIEQSTRLHILGLPSFLTNVPSGIGKLPTLQQLWGDFKVMDHEINGWVRELKDMNKFRGPLCISGLRNIVDVELCRNANLASKPNLHELILNFQEDCGMEYFIDDEEEVFEALHLHLTCHSSNNAKSENDEKIHNVVLESLQPHGNLTELRILNYGGRNFPSWLHNPLLPKLTTLTLKFYTEPNYLPPFGQLPHLRFLEILGGNLGDEPRTYSLWVEYDSSKQPKKPSYPSLKELLLRNMLNLVEWQANDGDFPCLEHLTIENCPKLVHVPLKDVLHSMIQMAEISDCPILDLRKRYLYKKDSMVEALMLFANNEIRLFYDFPSVNFQFPHLKSPLYEIPFTLFFTKEDFRGVQSLTREPWEGVSCQHIKLNLASLVKLEIVGCTNIISVIGLDNLSSLKHLYISVCPELCNWKDKTLPVSLESLELNYCPKLSSLPLLSVQNHSSTLKVLAIIKCPRLAVLEGFHGLMKLNTMNLLHCEIYDCPGLYLGERYVYQRDTTIKELNLSGNNEILLSDSRIPLLENQFELFLTKEDFQEVESLTCAPSVGVSCQHVILNLASLVILEIMRCTNIISVTGLDNLSTLKYLIISFCSELCNWKDKTLPVSLESLQLNSCPKLSSLPLLSVQNHSLLLTIHDCMLMRDWCHRNSITYYN